MLTVPHMEQCCCFRNIRAGSFASAVYTMIFYTIFFFGGAYHVRIAREDPVYLGFTVSMVVFAAFLILSSILLIIALYGENDRLMIPWMTSLSTFTLMDVVFLTSLLVEIVLPQISGPSEKSVDAFTIFLIVIDFFVIGLNVYCFLCVLNQYQSIRRQAKSFRRGSDPEQTETTLPTSSKLFLVQSGSCEYGAENAEIFSGEMA